MDASLPPAVPARAQGVLAPAPWLKDAERVAVVHHGGKAFVVAAGTHWLRIFSPAGVRVAEAREKGAAHVLEIVDVDGDGNAEIAVGRGLGRDARDASPSVTLYAFDGSGLGTPRRVPLPATTRAQIVGIVADPAQKGRLWIGSFDSKYHVTLVEAQASTSGAFTTQSLGRIRMPVSMAGGDPDGDGHTDLLIARPYGDSLDAPGDVFVFARGEQGTLLPSMRGARAVAVKGRDVVYADGWHREYARKGRALVTRARWDGKAWQAQTLVQVAGRYGYDRLRLGDVDGDGAIDAVAAGNGPAVLIRGLEAVAGDSVPALGNVDAMDAFVADLDGDGRDEVVIGGPSPGIWRYTE